MADALQLAVLNPGGNDREQRFPDGAGRPDNGAPHPPVNYHAYAACTRGAFYRDAARIPAEERAVLLVLRRDLKQCLKALRLLLAGGRMVAVTLKESGLHQVAQLLEGVDKMAIFREICEASHGCMASTGNLAGLYKAAGGRNVRFIPTPYPVDAPGWNFSLPLAQRSGIFIGTREWNTPSRNHAAALLLAGGMGAPVTVINEDGRAGRKRLAGVGLAGARVVEGRLPYPDYLRLMASHRIVWQLDRSAVPGQVAGDALLCGMPCVGGDGAIERIAFPEICGAGREPAALQEIATRLLRDDGAWEAAAAGAQRLAAERLSFAVIAEELSQYFAGLRR
jgi:hypothetical protein